MSDVLQRLGDAIKMLNERDATTATLTAELAGHALVLRLIGKAMGDVE